MSEVENLQLRLDSMTKQLSLNRHLLEVATLTAEELKTEIKQADQELKKRDKTEQEYNQKISKLHLLLEQSRSVDTTFVKKEREEKCQDQSECESTGSESWNKRRRRNLPSYIVLEQEEAFDEEKKQLQNQVEDQLKQISALEIQLDEMKLRELNCFGDDSQKANHKREMDKEKEESAVAHAMKEYETLKATLQVKEKEIITYQQTIKEKVEEITGLNRMLGEKMVELEEKTTELNEERRKTKEDIEISKHLLNEKDKKIDSLSAEIKERTKVDHSKEVATNTEQQSLVDKVLVKEEEILFLQNENAKLKTTLEERTVEVEQLRAELSFVKDLLAAGGDKDQLIRPVQTPFVNSDLLLQYKREELQKDKMEFESLIKNTKRFQNELKAELNGKMQTENDKDGGEAGLSNLQTEQDLKRRDIISADSEYKIRVQQLIRTLQLEEEKYSKLQRAFERELAINDKLRGDLYSEKRSSLEWAQKKNSIFKNMQLELDSEHASKTDLKNSMERENQRLQCQISLLESQTNALSEELERKRLVCEQIKIESSHIELQKVVITRHYEHERDQRFRLKSESEHLKSEIRSLKDLINKMERTRDTEKVTERRSQRGIQKERDDKRMKMLDNELEIKRLTQRLIDIEDQISASHGREMKALRELQLAHTLQTCTRSDSEEDQDHWKIYKTQLMTSCQGLQYLILQYQDQLSSGVHTPVDIHSLEKSLIGLQNQLKQTQMQLFFESENTDKLLNRSSAQAVNERVLHHNYELIKFVTRLIEDKVELRNTLGKFEEEIWRYRHDGFEHGKVNDIDKSTPDRENCHHQTRAQLAKEPLCDYVPFYLPSRYSHQDIVNASTHQSLKVVSTSYQDNRIGKINGTSHSMNESLESYRSSGDFSVHNTPPTKDCSSKLRTSFTDNPGARRKILYSNGSTSKSGSTSPVRSVGFSVPEQVHDDNIN